MILVFSDGRSNHPCALALIPGSPMDIWEPKPGGRKVFPNTHWCVNATHGFVLPLEDIIAQQLPVPHREMLPITWKNNRLLCGWILLKSIWMKRKTVECTRQSMAKYGEEGLSRFDRWGFSFYSTKIKLNKQDSNSYWVKIGVLLPLKP